MRNMVLDSEKKAIFIIKWQRTWLNYDLVWKVGFVSDELGYLTEDISKQSIEGITCFVAPFYSKMQKGRDRLKELLSTKEPELEDLEN